MYLSYAQPSWHRGDDRAREILELIVQDQQAMSDRIVDLIQDANGVMDFGVFAMEFTGYHDLSFSFLLQKLIEQQVKDLSAIERCIGELESHPLAKAVAEESLGAAKGHLESLQELSRPVAKAWN